MTEAADQAELDPDRLSFTRAPAHRPPPGHRPGGLFPPPAWTARPAEAIAEILERPNPPRLHRTCPRVVKRGRRNHYLVKRKADVITRRHGPPEIRIYAPADA